ncbi:MAG TPA: GAF domain-containing protein, partial [Chloroflexota bacterium]|nr:GAF domain-containing protein [Chloroflexota bacterium]
MAERTTSGDAAGLPADDADELTRLRRELAAARAEQAATASILRAIASGPADAQTVLQSIVEGAGSLCQADNVGIFRVVGDELERLVNLRGDQGTLGVGVRLPIDRGFISGRALIERRTIHERDIREADPWEYPISAALSLTGTGGDTRTLLSIPLLGEDRALGVLTAMRTEVRPFSEAEISLLERFADQAVIAIENARLFEELQESNRQVRAALEQQTATAEVLRVIASTPSNLQQVLTVLIAAACRLIEADGGAAGRFDGDEIVLIASTSPEVIGRRQPIEGTTNGRALLEARTVHVYGTAEEQLAQYPNSGAARRVGTQMVTPLLLDGRPIGTLAVNRRAIHPFSEQQISLLESFADQAVIAIENGRLFSDLEQRNAELQASNRQVTEALEQQTAMADILRVIASSPTDLNAVMQAIVDSAVRLCRGDQAFINRVEGDEMVRVASVMSDDEAPFPIGYRFPLQRAGIAQDAVREGRTINRVRAIDDIPPHPAPYWNNSSLAVPLTREATTIGALAVTRGSREAFSDREARLLETFADQAIIAIENARLFEELGQRNAELEESNRQVTEALEQQTAMADILRVIASSPTDLQPVLDTVASSAMRLSRSIGCDVSIV